MTDPRKLQRLEQYLREEGFEPTAGFVAKRLRELGAAQTARADDRARRLLEDEIGAFVSGAQVGSRGLGGPCCARLTAALTAWVSPQARRRDQREGAAR
jgi:hypothetical protein